MSFDSASPITGPLEAVEGLQESARVEADRHPTWRLAGFAVIACAVALAYTLFTGHVWEDYFITFRHSRNLAEGAGLVFNPGERVHGFTSPLGVLLPALFYYVTGRTSYVPALWLFRACSIAAYAAAGVLMLKSLRDDGAGRRLEGLFFGILYLLQATLLDYSINGQETGLMALFVAWGYSLSVKGLAERWTALGLCWAGLMWTRPDGFVYIAALAAANLVFPNAPRKVLWGAMLKSAGICTVAYLPWFAGTWWYYGSPIPHTIIAKSMIEAGPLVQIKIILKETIDRYFATAASAFQPIYYRKFGEWHAGLVLVSNLLGVFSSCYWLLPVRERSGRLASLWFALLCLYFTAIPNRFDWYFPPAAMLGLAVLVRGVWTLADEIRHRSPRSGEVAFLVLCALCAERALFFVGTAVQIRIQQEEIETKTRARIGLWLKDHVRRGEVVYLEPLGYIGYFSEARMADWPGLATPEVVRLRRENRCDFVSVVPELNPDWMVLRPTEVELMSRSKYFLENYAPVVTFDARPRLERHRWIPGRTYLNVDSVYTIYQKVLPGSHLGIKRPHA